MNGSTEMLEVIFQSARKHGEESELEHEVGDLQDALQLAWQMLSKDQRCELYVAFKVGVTDDPDSMP